jgi:hypothetical protein
VINQSKEKRNQVMFELCFETVAQNVIAKKCDRLMVTGESGNGTGKT